MMAMLSVKDYHIKESSNPTYFPGRCADILCGEQIVGSFGILHPQVLENFDIHFPCSSFEFNIEPFL